MWQGVMARVCAWMWKVTGEDAGVEQVPARLEILKPPVPKETHDEFNREGLTERWCQIRQREGGKQGMYGRIE